MASATTLREKWSRPTVPYSRVTTARLARRTRSRNALGLGNQSGATVRGAMSMNTLVVTIGSLPKMVKRRFWILTFRIVNFPKLRTYCIFTKLIKLYSFFFFVFSVPQISATSESSHRPSMKYFFSSGLFSFGYSGFSWVVFVKCARKKDGTDAEVGMNKIDTNLGRSVLLRPAGCHGIDVV